MLRMISGKSCWDGEWERRREILVQQGAGCSDGGCGSSQRCGGVLSHNLDQFRSIIARFRSVIAQFLFDLLPLLTLSEADPASPGTDKDVDYYQHKSTLVDNFMPWRTGWETASENKQVRKEC